MVGVRFFASADLLPVIASMKKLFEETAEAAGGAKAPMVKRREVEDNSKKLGGLFVKLNSGDVSPQVAGKLLQLSQFLAAKDFDSAMRIQVS